MKIFVYYGANGRIEAEANRHADQYAHLSVVEVEADSAGLGKDHYVASGALQPIPQRPSQAHQFDYASKQWHDPRTAQELLADTRAKRNALLTESDWTQLDDVPAATKKAWRAYRQALRDITTQSPPVWPDKPV